MVRGSVVPASGLRAARIRDESSTAETTDAAELRAAAHTPLLLRFTAFSLFFFPSSMVIKDIGAAGTVPMILSCLLFVFWFASWMWRLHDPVRVRYPGRLAGGIFALGILASYIALYGGWSGSASPTGLAAADRWLILGVASLGLIVVAGETVRSIADMMQLVRWLLAGAFFCGVVGLVQFTLHVNPMEWVQLAMPGFTYNGGDTPFQARGNLLRVAGSTFHSIEFGVVSAMVLPLSIWRALYDPKGKRWFHWLQTSLLVFAVAATVSRSGTLAAIVAIAVLLPFLPRIARHRTLAVLPFVVVALFIAVPGFVGTLTEALSADTSDPSIATRVNNYPRVARMIDDRPLFGVGPGNYTAHGALQILDNQYLNSIVSMGVIGLACVFVYLVLPGVAALHSARHAVSPALRCLAGASAAGLFVAAVCSVTFDSLSFPTFALSYPLLVGLSGAIWILVKNEGRALEQGPPLPQHTIRTD
jgi:O-antigen ligase